MSDSLTSSRESSPPSIEVPDIDDINLDSVTDETILSLLKKEIDLQIELEAVQAQVSELEKGVGKDDEEDEQGILKVQ